MKVVKRVKVPAGVKDKNIAEMFNQMLGTGGLNITIAYPRYMRIKNISEQMVSIITLFAQTILKDNIYGAEILKFALDSINDINNTFTTDLSQWMPNIGLCPDEEIKKFEPIYKSCKKCQTVTTLVLVYRNLLEYRSDVLAKRWQWLSMPINLFPFTKYSFSELPNDQPTQKFTLTVFEKLLEFGKVLFDEINAPDIDLDQFIAIVRANIEQLRKVPELHRCTKAFDKIIDSIGLLKTNFNEYYRDFLSTKNQTIIMEHFIIDVSKSTKADMETTRQFREIIKYYKKVTAETGANNNPKIKLLLDKVSQNFEELEQKSTLDVSE